MIREYAPLAYGIGGLTPHEFMSMTPAEFGTYITARIKREEEIVERDNIRVGLICATLQNGIPMGYAKPGAKTHHASDYFGAAEPEHKKADPQLIYNSMMAWTAMSQGAVHG